MFKKLLKRVNVKKIVLILIEAITIVSINFYLIKEFKIIENLTINIYF